MKDLRIVIADDSAVIREELDRAFSGLSGVRIVGVATDGAHAFWLAMTKKPDVLVLDLSLPKVCGLEVIQEIRKLNSEINLIVFSADPGMMLQAACLRAGADHYLNKAQLHLLVQLCQGLQKP
jgi:DNA-binding NarL/FixJ family response regulator